ncbi:hypothetical protein RCO28_25975 [Streptomyces sp. LHD-70]|uniref:hypothetical protein n=1 Tax=Streptomyces sp. LHD-70 TaxID=3072140 RepID=UPI00280E4E77|nr:hypothetical protein [Streptomyces sp. LHD-70]MDQ8705915.1 hypothetical protein [Streptomyces sp. LHD-70]
MTRARAGIAWARSRRGAVTTASAAVVCLGTLLAACGGDSSGADDGYVAIGAAGATPHRTGQRAVPPTGDVRMVPLEGEGEEDGEKGSPGSSDPESGNSSSGSGISGSDSGTGSAAPEDGPSGGLPSPGAESPAQGGESGNSGSDGGSSTEPSTPGEESERPSGPALLETGEPVREALKDRWCEKVTVEFHNSGGSPIRSGTVTFGTHVIGALGVDWATLESERKLPAPIRPGESATESWKLCVDAWRVPLGMHIETQDVSVKWK